MVFRHRLHCFFIVPTNLRFAWFVLLNICEFSIDLTLLFAIKPSTEFRYDYAQHCLKLSLRIVYVSVVITNCHAVLACLEEIGNIRVVTSSVKRKCNLMGSTVGYNLQG